MCVCVCVCACVCIAVLYRYIEHMSELNELDHSGDEEGEQALDRGSELIDKCRAISTPTQLNRSVNNPSCHHSVECSRRLCSLDLDCEIISFPPPSPPPLSL